MKVFTRLIVITVLILFSSALIAQNTVSYKFKVSQTITLPLGQFTNTTTVDEGSFMEGTKYIIPDATLPGDFSKLQPAYNSIRGGAFLLENESINTDIHLNIILGGLDAGTGEYFKVFGDTLFLNLEINVFVLPDSTLYEGDYFFNGDKILSLTIPKHPEFLNWLQLIGLKSDDLGFAYITDTGWNADDIVTISTPDSIAFKARHLSKFGGGKGQISSATSVELEGMNYIPSDFNLEQNYPNPFNPSTKIRFSIPTQGFVDLRVYNILGTEVETLVSKNLSAGTYEATFHAENLASGLYFYAIKSGKISLTKKMLLVK
ncbi:MAG: T9SS type A sorting domain-containing protein [Bacteroidetes bacterium]|nr:T9SS type A sorting domain-containing protein [Bacteroidota bacterium]MBU1679351.1 T9SS type A sorting domain-containing protein [Bacteroidota bacterium]MBU2507603.1 T9SS type A sorting domain-containing protein [Bacteroidota bacterium]